MYLEAEAGRCLPLLAFGVGGARGPPLLRQPRERKAGTEDWSRQGEGVRWWETYAANEGGSGRGTGQ